MKRKTFILLTCKVIYIILRFFQNKRKTGVYMVYILPPYVADVSIVFPFYVTRNIFSFKFLKINLLVILSKI